MLRGLGRVALGGQVVFVFQLWQLPLFADFLGQTVVMHDKDCVVGVPDAEWSETVAHDGEERNKNVVDDIDDVQSAGTEVDPAFASSTLGQL